MNSIRGAFERPAERAPSEREEQGGPTAPETSVLVVGEALLDVIDAQGQRSEHVGGSPANVALALGRRRVPVHLLTQVGADERGRAIVSHLERSGVHVLRESLRRTPTSVALARVDAAGHAEYDFELSWELFPPLDVPRSAVLHTGSVAAFLEPGAGSVRKMLRSSQAREITFDPNIRPSLLGSQREVVDAFEAIASVCTVVKLSEEDAAWLYPGRSIEDMRRIVLDLGPRLVAVTRGSDGAVIAHAQHAVHVPAVPVHSVDTIGAGDAFMSSLIESVLHFGSSDLDDHSLERFGQAAAHIAAIAVSRPGADPPWAHETR